MPVKRKPDQSIIEALNKAQHIAFGPVLFQAVRSALATGLLSHISEAEDTEAEAARACSLTPYAVGVLVDVLTAGDVVTKSEDGTLALTKTGQCLLFDEMTRVNFNFTADVCYRGMDHLTEALTEGKPAGLKELGDWDTIYPAISQLPHPARESWFAFDHYYSDRYFAMLAEELRDRLSPQTLVDWLKPDCVPVVEHKADVIWMSQFLDCFSPEEAVSILQRCKPLLSERGRFAVLECLVDGQKFPAAGFSLAAVSLYFTTMANGNSRFYRRNDLLSVFKNAGLDVEYCRDNVGVSHTLYILKPTAAK